MWVIWSFAYLKEDFSQRLCFVTCNGLLPSHFCLLLLCLYGHPCISQAALLLHILPFFVWLFCRDQFIIGQSSSGSPKIFHFCLQLTQILFQSISFQFCKTFNFITAPICTGIIFTVWDMAVDPTRIIAILVTVWSNHDWWQRSQASFRVILGGLPGLSRDKWWGSLHKTGSSCTCCSFLQLFLPHLKGRM